ncbi:hypothetical protein [Yersinia pekkanenii]|uniref:Phage head morphogenesis protein, SPP1 gp7 family n=1 Tax=Yersinia pekkanenii TaxID=1288385 RepID=A0A0T9PRJ7_9GAMM|nr:hypothetical protein [Yersinia pekkanenii]CNH77891.1 Uncharacterised protein [Yersinia pekkanenii]CRY69366.1 Uncharacterised protein [Yersinia pekkanenii]
MLLGWLFKKKNRRLVKDKIPSTILDIKPFLVEEVLRSPDFDNRGENALVKFYTDECRAKDKKMELFKFIHPSVDTTTIKKQNAIIDGIYHRARARSAIINRYNKLISCGAEMYKVSVIIDHRCCDWCKKNKDKRYPISVNFPSLWEANCKCHPHSLTDLIILIEGADY